MTENQKTMCDNILRCGDIIEDKNFTCDGDYIRQYIINYCGVKYILSKCNGEWIYLYIA